jgi:hypothetical protein
VMIKVRGVAVGIGRARLPYNRKKIAGQNDVSGPMGVLYLKAAEPSVAQPTARQRLDNAPHMLVGRHSPCESVSVILEPRPTYLLELLVLLLLFVLL